MVVSHMRIECLEEFIVLAKYMSFTEAAHVLNMSQPTLSKHISSLELELKAPLFTRNKSSLELTMAGKMALTHAFTIMESYKHMVLAAKQGASMSTPHLVVGGNVGLRAVIECINALDAHFTERFHADVIELSDIATNPYAPVNMNDPSSPDLLFVYMDENADTGDLAETRLITRSSMCAIVSKHHRLANRESITLDDLRTETLIKLEGNFISSGWTHIEAMCVKAGFTPNCRHVYFPRITDLLKTTTHLQQDVLLFTDESANQHSSFISEKCTIVPVVDERAYMPLVVAYSMSNANPLIDEALDVIFELKQEAVRES